jgi:hypothetical protein
VDIDDSTIKGNVAAYGGGILNHLGKLDICNVHILNNKAKGLSRTNPEGEGGGVWTFGPSYKAEGCNIKDNLPDNVYTKPYPPPPW